MNSEKVKKIKKVLEQNTKTYLLYDFEKNTECKVFQCKHILDYINELEECSKKWQKLCADEVAFNTPLKERIKELESENDNLYNLNQNLISDKQVLMQENERLIKKNNHLLDRNRDLIRVCDTCKISIKQFAERLKKISCEMYLKEQLHWCIDETLKDFINKGDDN